MGSVPRQDTDEPRSGAQGSARPVRVMIVDDSLVVRTVLSRIIAPETDIEIVGKTGSAELAIAQLARTPADVVLLDLEMPGMGGLEALPRILKEHENTQVLVVSSLTEEGAEYTVAALSMGAADTMLKPRPGQFGDAYRDALLAKIRALGPDAEVTSARSHRPLPTRRARNQHAVRPSILAIGASTGGIHAVSILLRNLPAWVDLPILVAQHLPASFAGVFARQLQCASGRETLVAVDGMTIAKNTIYVANGEGHMVVERKGELLQLASLHHRAPSGCTPSVDPLFESLARAVGPETLAVVLSGMGRDGAYAAPELVSAGGTIFVQDQESAAVWGMPRAIAEAGLAEAVLPPDQLALRIAAASGGAA